MIKMEKENVRFLFECTGFKVLRILELNDQYEPNRAWPWFFVKTPEGYFLFGPRHRVISIDWEDTSFRGSITSDDVTKTSSMIHAWSMVKVIEYLSLLKVNLTSSFGHEKKVGE